MNNGLSYTPIHDHDWTDDHASHSSILIIPHYDQRSQGMLELNSGTYYHILIIQDWRIDHQLSSMLIIYLKIFIFIFLGINQDSPLPQSMKTPSMTQILRILNPGQKVVHFDPRGQRRFIWFGQKLPGVQELLELLRRDLLQTTGVHRLRHSLHRLLQQLSSNSLSSLVVVVSGMDMAVVEVVILPN